MPKITSIQTFPFSYPTLGRFRFFEGPGGKPLGRPSVFIKMVTDDGVVGWGQSVPIPKWSYETTESVCTTIECYLAPELLGQEARDIEGIHALMNRAIAPSFSTGQPIAKAGIDLALHDLAGKRERRTVWERLGGREKRSVTLSWTLNPKALEDVPNLVEEGLKRGYRHFNVKVAPDPVFDLELCRMVKRLVPDGFLWADANGGYDEATALSIAPRLADLGVPVLEQPLPANRLSGYRRLKEQGALPIIMDEGIVSSVELEEFMRLGLLDGVAMKPARCGGLTEARRQIERIRDAGMLFLGSGLTDPDISLAASLALYAAYDLHFPAALNGPQFLQGSVLREPIRVLDGVAWVPEGMGLGGEVDESLLSSRLAG